MANTYTTSTSSMHKCLSSTGFDSSSIQQPNNSNQYQERIAYCAPTSKNRSSPELMKGELQLNNIRTDNIPNRNTYDSGSPSFPYIPNYADLTPSELGCSFANNEKSFSQGRLEENSLIHLDCEYFQLPAEEAEFDSNCEMLQGWIGPTIEPVTPILPIMPIFSTIEPALQQSTILEPLSHSSFPPIFNRGCATQILNEQGNSLEGSGFLDPLNHLELRQDGGAFDIKPIQATPLVHPAKNSELEMTQKFNELKLGNDGKICEPICILQTQNQVQPAYIDRKEHQTIEDPKAIEKADVEVEVQKANETQIDSQINPSMLIYKPEISNDNELSYNTIYFLLNTIYNAKAALSKGIADPNSVKIQDEDGDTELMICLYKMEIYSDVAWSLLCCSQTPETLNLVNKQGQNALHVAVQYAPGAQQLIRALVVLGCDPTAYDVCGQTPLHYAAELGRSDLLRVMLKPFWEGERAVYHTMYGYPLATNDSNDGLVNVMNTKGETLLFTAVEHRQVETAKVLLKIGADPCISTYNYLQTPLLQAVLNRDLVMIRVLLSYEMYSDKQHIINQLQRANLYGQSPLSLSKEWLNSGNRKDSKIHEIAIILKSAAKGVRI